MNRQRYEALPADLRKIIDDTTGLKLSLKGASTYDQAGQLALVAARKQRDVYELPKAEYDRWLAHLQPLIAREAKRVDALGRPGTRLVRSYGLMS
jgi:TRAP-type transport system periplasmic protein